MPANRMRQIGIAQILASGVAYGFLTLFGKWALGGGLTPGEFLALRFLLGAGLLGGWIFGTAPRSLRVGLRTLFICGFLGVFGYALFSTFFFRALQGLSASLTVLLLYTYPVIVTLGAWAFFGQRPRRLALAALPLVCLGLWLLIAAEFRVYAPRALAYGLLAAVFYSAYILASSRLLSAVVPAVATFYIMLAAGLVLGGLYLRLGTMESLPGTLPVVVATALLCTVMAMSLFLSGLKKLSGMEASLLSTAEPLTGLLLAALFLGERMQAGQWVGAGLILVGMVMVARAGK